MKSEIKIPFFLINRFLLRGNKWTLLLIIFLMSIAFINLIFITSLFNGIIEMTNDQIINTTTGNIMITPKEGKDFIENRDETLEKINQTEGVQAASAETNLPANLKYKNIKGNWQVLAINPFDEAKVTNIKDKIISGSYLETDDSDQILIGRQIAGGKDVEMNEFSFKTAKVGDKVTLSLDSLTKDFTIKGIFFTKYILADNRAFITQEALDKLAPRDFYDNKANNILVKINKKGDEEKIIERFKAEDINENFITWKDAAGLMKSVSDSFSSINALMTIVGVIIAAVTIFIVIYIDISHKRQQIGILRAIGIKPYLINATYVLQTVVYSCFGVLLGAALFFGIIMPYFKANPFILPIGDAVLRINYPDFVFRFELIIFTAMLAGLIPSILITRMKLLNAIWGK